MDPLIALYIKILNTPILSENSHMNEKIKIFRKFEEFEQYSKLRIEQVDSWNTINEDIRWFANCVDKYTNENITDYYLKNPIARNTRWNLWNGIIKIYKKNNIKSNLDIGCANNHFSFLLNKSNIFSVGIDPRADFLKSSYDIFRTKFYSKEKYGYLGNIRTFVDFFSKCDEVIFDRVSILNFLHGDNHKTEEIKKLFEVLPKISSKIIISEPKWGNLNLPPLTKNYKKIGSINKRYTAKHILFDLNQESDLLSKTIDFFYNR